MSETPAASAQSRIFWPTGVSPSDEFAAAINFARDTRENIFITGRAGTGKSTLLRCIRINIPQKTAVLAPTGLAAVNVNGQTIHSFFGFPPQLITADVVKRCRRAGMFRNIETLIIDEISMVRADLMQGIDMALRMTRKKPTKPFGGVQLITMGDQHQLPPVIRDQEMPFFRETFGGVYFFHAPVFQDAPLNLVELKKVYRQQDAEFLEALNGIREGSPTREHLEILNSRVAPTRSLELAEEYIVLTPLNKTAEDTNKIFLDRLKGSPVALEAAVNGKFEASAFPTDGTLILKEGAKVVMVRNDPEKRWVNGTQARISRMKGKNVWIEIDGDEHPLEPVAWENIRYDYDADTDKMVETVVGSFKQLPIRLAWALTIHKSQGMTLDKVYVNFGRGTFAHGQAYVALSRCRSLQGLSLARPIYQSDIVFDPRALGYRERVATHVGVE